MLADAAVTFFEQQRYSLSDVTLGLTLGTIAALLEGFDSALSLACLSGLVLGCNRTLPQPSLMLWPTLLWVSAETGLTAGLHMLIS